MMWATWWLTAPSRSSSQSVSIDMLLPLALQVRQECPLVDVPRVHDDPAPAIPPEVVAAEVGHPDGLYPLIQAPKFRIIAPVAGCADLRGPPRDDPRAVRGPVQDRHEQ